MSTNAPRTNLGPLLTTFTPAANCAVVYPACRTCTVGWRAQTCFNRVTDSYGNEDDPYCWPERSGTATTSTPTGALAGWGFYSPGTICPSGYSSACSATGYGVSGWPVQFSLYSQETAVGCCPTGYSCVNNFLAQTCNLRPSASIFTFPIITCSAGSAGLYSTQTLPAGVRATTTNSAYLVSTTNVYITSYDLYAPMIQINWQSSDLPKTSITTSGGSVVTVTQTPTSVPKTQASSGLSTGAQAGIGVGVGVAIIVIGVLSWLLFRRRRKDYTPAASHSPVNTAEPPLSEIGGDGIYEMANNGKQDGYNPVELPAHGMKSGKGYPPELGTE